VTFEGKRKPAKRINIKMAITPRANLTKRIIIIYKPGLG
jgi:hypothetical protein